MVRLSARTTDTAVDLMRFEMPNLLEDMSNRSSSNMATTLGADGYVTVETLTTFRFDNRNNRISRTVTGAESYVMTYTYDLNNRLLSKTRTGSNPATTTFTYDRNGNQLTQTTGNSTMTLHYDVFNHLVRVVHGNMVAVYDYRADGLRHSKTVNGHKTTHVWGRGSIILELNQSGAVVNRFSRGVGHLIHSYHHGFYLFNVRTDVVQRVDNAGNVIHTYRYDAFGNQLNGSETNTNPFRFAGEYYDGETGFIYLRARFYNPLTGRMLSEDPHWTIDNMIFGDDVRRINEHLDRYTMIPDVLAIMQAANLFVFGINNPVRFIDPSGLRVVDLGRGWSARIERGVPPQDQRHVHVIDRNGNHWSQNDDGSPHDRGNNSGGNPPRRVLERLKERTGWDWREKQNSWVETITISDRHFYEWGESLWADFSRTVEFADGRVVTWRPQLFSTGMPMGTSPTNAELANLYLNISRTQNAGSINSPVMTPVPTAPSTVPAPSTTPAPIRMPTIRVPVFRLF